MSDPRGAFEGLYGTAPTHLARAPGRVNLIGEHIDYAGLAVLPMAIQREVRIAFRPVEEPVLTIASDLPGLEPRSFRLDGPLEPYPPGDWGNYAKAAALALRMSHEGAGPGIATASDRRLLGLEAFVASDLPVAAGLSSSSALVVGCALAMLTASGTAMDPLELAALTAEAERFTGTRGGGMDQAICLCAREGTASIIEFDPLRVDPVPVPAGWRFVVAHSLIQARKSGAAQAAYNRRRADVESAVGAMAAELGRSDRGAGLGSAAHAGSGRVCRDLLEAHGPDALLDAADRSLTPELRRRFRHVVTEAGRVGRARDAMLQADRCAFGTLMNASHDSLRGDFEVSTPELDELVAIATGAGAAGARLTGAGLGGAIVALTGADRVDELLGALEAHFYAPRRADGSRAMFVAAPSGGAAARRIDEPASG